VTYDDLGEQLEYIDDVYGDDPGPDVPRQSRMANDPRRFHRIDTNESDLKVLTAKAWNAIEAFNTKTPYLFANGITAVRLVGGKHDRPTVAQDLTVDTISRESAETAFWMKLMDKGRIIQPVFPPSPVMKNMLADPDPPLPQIRRITSAPVFGPQGEFSTTPGYNPDTFHFFDDRGLVIPAVSTAPAKTDVDRAVRFLLDEFLVDFPFVSRSEVAHALSLLLNPFVRDMIDGPTPLYLIEAPTAGTGKGLLASVLLYPALGVPPMLMTQSDNEEETRKRITSTLTSLPEAVLIDNIGEGLNSPNLAAVLTTREWTDRVLGRSEIRTVPVRCTWMATGNNPTKSGEMARRTIRIRLDSKTERPEERHNFRHTDLERWTVAHRGELVHAALTIVRGWIAEGSPRSNHILGSYGDWAAVHGGILQTCDVAGFLENRTEDRLITVTEDAAWGQLVQGWWANHGPTAVGASELFTIARDIDEFPLGRSPTERGQRTAFGLALTRNRNRVFGEFEITFEGVAHKVAQYRLVRADDRAAA